MSPGDRPAILRTRRCGLRFEKGEFEATPEGAPNNSGEAGAMALLGIAENLTLARAL
jgi:hypothetical protein